MIGWIGPQRLLTSFLTDLKLKKFTLIDQNLNFKLHILQILFRDRFLLKVICIPLSLHSENTAYFSICICISSSLPAESLSLSLHLFVSFVLNFHCEQF